jgi:hypothetical protein
MRSGCRRSGVWWTSDRCPAGGEAYGREPYEPDLWSHWANTSPRNAARVAPAGGASWCRPLYQEHRVAHGFVQVPTTEPGLGTNLTDATVTELGS